MGNLKKRKGMWITLAIIGVIGLSVFLFVNQKSFGKISGGERKARIEKSLNYRDGKFQNLNHTPQLTGDKGYVGALIDFVFEKKERLNPTDLIPSVKTDLHKLDRSENVLVWFGHSSYLLQVDGKRFLIDPVLSGAGSPVSFVNKPFKGADTYKSEDIPEVDFLVISHDHWDHLDYKTVMTLKDRIGKVICGLGVGAHFEYWGFDTNNIIEMDWDEEASLGSDFTVNCLPARHFSGRGLSPNQSLWASFLFQTPSLKFYIGGDSGYDTHFARIGERFGEIDLAILENGQYGEGWKFIHMMPEEVLKASKELKAKRLFPVHNSKFALGQHAWDEPMVRMMNANKTENLDIMTPIIGEVVNLNDTTQVFTEWWLGLK